MKKLGGQRLIILLLAAVTAVSLCVTVWAVFFRPAPAADYAQTELEPNAVPYEKEDAKPQRSGSGGSVSIQYTKEVLIHAAEKTADLYYANPPESKSGVAVQLLLLDPSGQETVLGNSGLLQPGTKLEKLALDSAGYRPGSYEGKFVLTFYDMDSGEKAILNTVVDGLKVRIE